jgi:hypothetical protein
LKAEAAGVFDAATVFHVATIFVVGMRGGEAGT